MFDLMIDLGHLNHILWISDYGTFIRHEFGARVGCYWTLSQLAT